MEKFPKKSCGISTYDKWNFKPQILSIFHFDQVSDGRMAHAVFVKANLENLLCFKASLVWQLFNFHQYSQLSRLHIHTKMGHSKLATILFKKKFCDCPPRYWLPHYTSLVADKSCFSWPVPWKEGQPILRNVDWITARHYVSKVLSTYFGFLGISR